MPPITLARPLVTACSVHPECMVGLVVVGMVVVVVVVVRLVVSAVGSAGQAAPPRPLPRLVGLVSHVGAPCWRVTRRAS